MDEKHPSAAANASATPAQGVLDAAGEPRPAMFVECVQDAVSQMQRQQYSLADEFGIDVPKDLVFEGLAAGQHFAVPRKQDDYAFTRPLLRDMLAFWESGEPCMKLFGFPGTGKTSGVQQFHARMRWPLYVYPCSPSTEAYHLIGQLLPDKDGTLRWSDGVALRAYREGASVCFDEYNVMDPGATTNLNSMMDRVPIYIPETGEIVHPAPTFRMFATENPVDSQLAVAGRNHQDEANEERWMVTEVHYLPMDKEIEIVRSALIEQGSQPDQADVVAKTVVGVAARTREAYRNREEAITKPMSTRVAKRWAKLIRRFQRVSEAEGGPVLYALRRSLRMSPDMDKAMEAFSRALLGT